MGRAKKTNGYYVKTFTFDGKKIFIRSAKSETDAVEKMLKKKEELEALKEAKSNPTINAYYESFTNIRRKLVSECTLRAQKKQYELIAGVEVEGVPFGEMHIKDIQRKDILEVRQILLDAGKTPQHLNICFAHLNHVFNNAVIDDTLIKNPCKSLKRLKRETAPINETKHRALTVDETIKFFRVAEERNSYYINLFSLMLKTGLRIGEACALYLTDIDKTKGFIHVKRTVTRTEAGGYVIGDNTKTKNGERDIPLTSDIIAIINKQIELNELVFGGDWSGELFQSIEHGVLREYTVNREIKRICLQAGIDKFTCHAFRNTFATRFIEQRPQDYKILSEILGHKDINITLELYTHVMVENKVNAMQNVCIKIV